MVTEKSKWDSPYCNRQKWSLVPDEPRAVEYTITRFQKKKSRKNMTSFSQDTVGNPYYKNM